MILFRQSKSRMALSAALGVALLLGMLLLLARHSPASPTSPLQDLTVNSWDPNGVTSTVLDGSTIYRIAVRGTYNHQGSNPAYAADAECSTAPTDSEWRRERYSSNNLDLLVDGSARDWIPLLVTGTATSADPREAPGCDTVRFPTPDPTYDQLQQDHVYQIIFTPGTSRAINFRILDGSYGDNSGTLNVKIYDTAKVPLPPVPTLPPVPNPIPTLPPVPNPIPTLPPVPNPTPLPAPIPTVTPLPSPPPAPIPIPDPGPLPPPLPGPGPLPTPPPVPSPPPLPAPPALPMALVQVLNVDTLSSTGTDSVQLNANDTYRVVAKGTYNYHVGSSGFFSADAECSTTSTTEPWSRERFPNAVAPYTSTDSLDLLVDGAAPDWVPVAPSGPDPTAMIGAERETMGCNTLTTAAIGPVPAVKGHTYETYFTPGTTRSVNFRILDDTLSDNSGNLTVEIYRVGTSATSPVRAYVGTAAIPANRTYETPLQNIGGAGQEFVIPQLTAGHTYEIRASGAYQYASASNWPVQFFADAECSTYYDDFPRWLPNRFTAVAGQPADPLDLLVGGNSITWTPLGQSIAGCSDPSHTYVTTYTASGNRTLTFRVNEAAADYNDNKGYLFVQVFELN